MRDSLLSINFFSEKCSEMLIFNSVPGACTREGEGRLLNTQFR